MVPERTTRLHQCTRGRQSGAGNSAQAGTGRASTVGRLHSCWRTTFDATSRRTASKHFRSAASGRCRRRAVSGCRHDACTCMARNRSAVRPCSCQQASNACKRTLRSPSIPAGRTRSFPPAQSIVSSTRQQQRAASSFAAACVLLGRSRHAGMGAAYSCDSEVCGTRCS